jgi:biopolymer transport protein ExbB/TolQ
MNIILGQGSAIKEVHNVKKQNLEISQQFVVQNIEEKKKEEKDKVKDFEKSNRIDIQNDEEKKKSKKGNKRSAKKKKQEEKNNLSEGNIIDITI